MNAIDLIILNFNEIRRRSIKAWRSLPDEYLHWRPDPSAFSFGEMIRHVWVSDHEYLRMLQAGKSVPDSHLYRDVPIESVEKEIEYARPYRQALLDWIRSLDEKDLEEKIIDRSDKGYKRKLGDMLLRIAYHESVHTGQFLQYMRMLQVKRPNIWD